MSSPPPADSRDPSGVSPGVPPSNSPAASGTTDTHDPVAVLLDARPRDLDGFSVRRALPSMKQRVVGPFIFFDHMGPSDFAPGHGIDVRPRPHIALATLTYLFAAEIVHRDSLGSHQAIRPGNVSWMLAGRGLVHSERTGDELRRSGSPLHGIQSWASSQARIERAKDDWRAGRFPTVPGDDREVIPLPPN